MRPEKRIAGGVSISGNLPALSVLFLLARLNNSGAANGKGPKTMTSSNNPYNSPEAHANRPLTETDRTEIFKLATRSLEHWFGYRFEGGMTDDELANALEVSLGIFGGSGGPNRTSVEFTGSGLRIWGGWHIVNHCADKPLFEGKRTIAMAREVYGIPNPEDEQLSLL